MNRWVNGRFLSLQYNIKTVNKLRNKEGDKNRKKGDETKSEDKDNSNTGTAGVHVGETTTPQDASTPSNGSSIGAHISNVTEPVVWSTQSIQDILAAHPIGDTILSHTDAWEVSIDTVNTAEALAGTHIIQHDITQGSTYTLCGPNPSYDLLTLDAYVPPDSSEDDRMYQCMDNYDKWDKSPNTAGVNDMGSSHTYTGDDTSDSTNESIKSNFWIGERQS